MIHFQVHWKSNRLKIDADLIPVLLVAVPLGRLGDQHGRRKIMTLALLGVAGSLSEIFIVCEFPFSNTSASSRSYLQE